MKHDLSHFSDIVEHQDAGADCVIVHPVTGEAMADIVFTVAGPDSNVQRRARLRTSDELLQYRGQPSAEDQLRMSIEQLARCVVGWRVTHDSRPLEFSFTNVVRILTKFAFIRDQVEAFSQNRTPYFARTPFVEEDAS